MLTWLGSRRIGGPHDWNMPDEVRRALRVLAAQYGRSAEVEIRDILERAVKPAKRVRLGDAAELYNRDIEAHWQILLAFDRPELFGDEWHDAGS